MLEYVAGAMEPAERDALEAHLSSGCVSCAAALAEAHATYAAVGLSAPVAAVDPVLRQRILDQASRSPSAGATPGGAGLETLGVRLFRLFVPAAVAAGFAVIITHAVVMHRARAMQTRAAQAVADARAAEMQAVLLMRSQLDTATHQADSLKAQLVEQEQQRHSVDQLLRQPGLQLVHLASATGEAAAVRLLYDPGSGEGLLLTAGLAPAPAGKTYELWYIRANDRARAAVFTPAASGEATVVVPPPKSVQRPTLAAVTIEPAGGTDSPTGAVQWSAKLD